MDRIDELTTQQGWTDASIGSMAVGWIRANGHIEAFAQFLEETVKVENEILDAADEEYDSEEEDGPPTDG